MGYSCAFWRFLFAGWILLCSCYQIMVQCGQMYGFCIHRQTPRIFRSAVNNLDQGVGNMCSNTKKKIAMALRQLMNERPFDKITVQNLMDMTQMKRQSFYYHFQDTRDVLMWICRRDVFEPLMESELELEDWMILALELLDRDRCFYRKILKAAYLDFLQEFDTIMEPRMLALLYPGRTIAQLSAKQQAKPAKVVRWRPSIRFVSIAAVVAVLIAAGAFFLGRHGEESDFTVTQEGAGYYADLQALTEDEIIEYLISTGVELDDIEQY